MELSRTSLPLGRRAKSAPANPDARIGPNAITQLEAVLLERMGREETQELFAGAGLETWLGRPPSGMVDEVDVARLHHEVRWRYCADTARSILEDAGDATARYILAHRIPKPVAVLLKSLPAFAAAPLLMSAIRRHAWTFAGSGAFRISREQGLHGPIVARIAHNPMVALDHSADPICAWHGAVFQRLFRALVHPRTRVTETDCCAAGAAECRFEIRFD